MLTAVILVCTVAGCEPPIPTTVETALPVECIKLGTEQAAGLAFLQSLPADHFIRIECRRSRR